MRKPGKSLRYTRITDSLLSGQPPKKNEKLKKGKYAAGTLNYQGTEQRFYYKQLLDDDEPLDSVFEHD